MRQPRWLSRRPFPRLYQRGCFIADTPRPVLWESRNLSAIDLVRQARLNYNLVSQKQRGCDKRFHAEYGESRVPPDKRIHFVRALYNKPLHNNFQEEEFDLNYIKEIEVLLVN